MNEHLQPHSHNGAPPHYAQYEGAPQAPYGFAPMAPVVAAAPLPRPGKITAASIMWITYGSLSLLANIGVLSRERPGPMLLASLAIAISFLVAGIQGLTGRARGMLANGIVSLSLGGLVLLAMAVMAVLAGGLSIKLVAIVFTVGFVIGGLLVVAGILACSGNSAYKAWRASRGLR